MWKKNNFYDIFLFNLIKKLSGCNIIIMYKGILKYSYIDLKKIDSNYYQLLFVSFIEILFE